VAIFYDESALVASDLSDHPGDSSFVAAGSRHRSAYVGAQLGNCRGTLGPKDAFFRGTIGTELIPLPV
jgi:hypothetical protein